MRMLKIKSIGFILALLTLPQLLLAQASKIPYMCGFEEDEDLSCWVIDSTKSDKWIVGDACHSEGKQALYISCDKENTLFGNQPTITVSYLRFKFPEVGKQANYDLSFDWKCIGNAANSTLYCMICPEFALTDPAQSAFYLGNITKAANKGNLPADTKNECVNFNNGLQYLSGSSEWHNVSLQNDIKISNSNSKRVFAIVFIWVNNNTQESAQTMGICIDNLQIASARVKKPTNLSVTPSCTDSTLVVKWESALDHFVVEYRKSGTSTWRRADGLTEGADNFYCENSTYYTYVITRVLEGRYDVRVQGSLNKDTSAYVAKSQITMYCPYNHCINYLDLENPNLVCTYGQCGIGSYSETPYAHLGYVTDEDPKKSRHTINFDQFEYDLQTDTMLKVIPDGALGSVRLGNWNTGGEGESMTYTFHVDTSSAAILICKYAIVLEKPGDGCGDPGFKMELFDANDNPISDDELCGIPDFTYSKAAAEGWTRTRDETTVWKDWTSVGINLMKYNNQDIKVRMTTWDCGAGGHFGYAYFTLDCAAAHIETENCGNDAKVVCEAPEGFAYRWSDETGKVVSREAVLEVDAGRHTYTCRVSFIEDSTCYFEVSTISAPRFPVPAFTYAPLYEDCTSRLRFTDRSHVMNKYEGFERHTSEPCTDFHWYFTSMHDGTITETTNPSPVYLCRNEGDTILIRFTAYIGENNACDSTLDSIIIVPSIIAHDSTMAYTICEGESFYFGGQWRDKDSTYVITTPNFAGCDSVSTLHLTVNPKSPETELFDSICSTQYVTVGGRKFNQPGDYSVWLSNRFECDSVVNLHLYVNQKLDVLPEPMEEICADNMVFNISYLTLDGAYDSIWVDFSPAANKAGLRDTMITEQALESIAIPYSSTITPGNYGVTLKFIQHCCDTLVEKLPFEIHYASSIMEQKWNDVIALLSSQYNGGYSFTEYQWYQNGQPISGQTRSYLYQPLQEGVAYSVKVTRQDGVSAMTCPVYYTYHQQVREYPTLAQPSQAISMRMSGASTMRFVSSNGQVYSQHEFPQGTITVHAPAIPGVYVWQTLVEGEDMESHYLIVTK